MPVEVILPVILCGGSGSRLWPLSRKSFPKQFLTLNLTNNKSLLQRTQIRTSKIKNIENPILICNEEHRFIAAEQMREINVEPSSIILEPFGRNTAPAIAVAALKALEIYEDPNLLILSSDHLINEEDKYIDVIEKGLEYSEDGKLVTFGIVPKSPETGYGYIKSVENLNHDKLKGSAIDSFIEKPDKIKALSFIKDTRFTWNSGIFLFKANSILKEIQEFSPEIIKYSKLALNRKLFDLDFQRLEEEFFRKCPDISIDVGVMEKTKNGIVLPLDAGWSDIGSWDTIWDISQKDSNGNVIEGNVVARNTNNSFLSSHNRLLTTIGLNDLIVVETSDAILVANKKDSQEVKNIVKILKEKGIDEGEENQKTFRPWGNYETLLQDNGWKLKLITVKVGERLSLQKHKYRAENWVIVSGTAKVEIDDTEVILEKNQSCYIPLGAKHRLFNWGEIDLKIIEVQIGAYLGEDDIERFDDKYGRILK